ncbi:hypothetical protein BJX66DRAFT_328447 [Aspergillus keveii]|uniref:Uncharacterized protein n=1 Tax=Aspergillus keveii TaxID=714993 RepID=A0ABR4FTQ7_9EURO
MHLPQGLAFAAGFCAMLQSAAIESLIPGFDLVDVAWDVEIFPGGPHIVLNGTVQQVYAQLIEINPDFSIDLSDLFDYDDDDAAVVVDDSLRDYFCFGRWPGTSRRRIGEGIRYLRGLPGTPSLPPGPGSCGRVSCSYNAAIFVCNDNTGYPNLNSWNLVADGADYINSRCIGGGDTAGQVFYHENWNVIVRQDNC